VQRISRPCRTTARSLVPRCGKAGRLWPGHAITNNRRLAGEEFSRATGQVAGPEAIVAWLVGGAALMLIALVMANLVSYVGSKDFGGRNAIPAPWDSVLVAVIGLACYEWGVRSAVRHRAVHPAPEPAGADNDDMAELGAAPDAE